MVDGQQKIPLMKQIGSIELKVSKTGRALFAGPIWCWLPYLPQLQLHMVINLYILSSWLLLFFCLLGMLWTFYSFLTDQRGFTGREWVLFLGRHKLKPAFYFSLGWTDNICLYLFCHMWNNVSKLNSITL